MENIQNNCSNPLPEISGWPLASGRTDMTHSTHAASGAYDVIELQRLAAEGGRIARRMSRVNVIN